MTSLTRPICLSIKGIHFLRGNPKGIHQQGLSLSLDNYLWWIILFIKYSTSNIILRIEMSTVNLKIVFVKKQKQTREHSTQGRGRGIDL